MRLDQYLVEKGYFSSRAKAQNEIKAGNVLVNEKANLKASFIVDDKTDVKVKTDEVLKYVSRGGLKLEEALRYFKINPSGLCCLDIGASTGGFTDCLLKNGASEVYAIDVGTSQLVSSLKNDDRVHSFEETNFLTFDLKQLKKIDLITIDVSFIKVETILDHVISSFKDTKVVFLIKPEFECGKTYFKGGIVKDPAQREEVLVNIRSYFELHGITLSEIIKSPILGGSGNIEYLACFSI